MIVDTAAAAPCAPARHSEQRRVVLAIIVTTLLWASAFVAIRTARSHFGPGPLALGRLLVGAVALSVLMMPRTSATAGAPRAAGDRRLRRAVVRVSTTSRLNQGERLVDAGTAAMLVNVAPILIAVLATWVLRERPLSGCWPASAWPSPVRLLIAVSSATATARSAVLACVLLAACVYTVAVVIEKPLLERVSPIAVTWAACLAGAVVCLPFLPALVSDLRAAPRREHAAGRLPRRWSHAIAFTTWAYALSHSTMARQGATTYLVPPLVIALSWLALGEVPGIVAMGGGLLCLAGVALTRRRSSSA